MAINWTPVDLSEQLNVCAVGEMIVHTTNVDSTLDPVQDLEDLLRRPSISLAEQVAEVDETWTISTHVHGHQHRFETAGIITSVIGFFYPAVKQAFLVYTKMDPARPMS